MRPGSPDFFVVTRVGEVPKVPKLWDYMSVLVFLGMLIVVAQQYNDDRLWPMGQAALNTLAIMVLGGWVSPQEAITCIDFKLLAMIGASLGMAKSISASGLDEIMGNAVRDADVTPLAA